MQFLSGTGTGSRILIPLESSDLSFLFFSSLSVSPLSGNALISHMQSYGGKASDTARLRSLLGIPASVKPALLLISAACSCSTRFTRVLSHASEIRRGKPLVRRVSSPSIRHTLSFLQRRRHDKTQIREARLEHERPHLAEIRRKQAFPCCLHPNRPQTLRVVPETCPLILPYFFLYEGIKDHWY